MRRKLNAFVCHLSVVNEFYSWNRIDLIKPISPMCSKGIRVFELAHCLWKTCISIWVRWLAAGARTCTYMERCYYLKWNPDKYWVFLIVFRTRESEERREKRLNINLQNVENAETQVRSLFVSSKSCSNLWKVDNFSVKMDSGQVVDKIFVPMVCRGIIPSESAWLQISYLLSASLRGIRNLHPGLKG